MVRPFRPFPLVLLALALVDAGCGPTLSPEAQCFAEATIAYRGAWRGAQKTRADLARGYALHTQEIPTIEMVPCRIGGVRSSCIGNARERITIPVAIDRDVLTERLDTLEARMEALRPAAMDAAAPCGYGDWATQPVPP